MRWCGASSFCRFSFASVIPTRPALNPFAASVSKNTCAQLFGAHFVAVESVASCLMLCCGASHTHIHTNIYTYKQLLLAGTQRTNKRPKVCTAKLLQLLCCLLVAAASLPSPAFSCSLSLSLSVYLLLSCAL